MARVAEIRSAEIASILSIGWLGKRVNSADTRKRLEDALRATLRFRIADVADKVVLFANENELTAAFFADTEAPLECATEIARKLANDPGFKWRIGIHSGRVQRNAEDQTNNAVTGDTVDLAQALMRTGDGGHILLSKRAAFDVAAIARWNESFHELGDYELQDRQKLAVVNFYDGEIGNREAPLKIRRAQKRSGDRKKPRVRPIAVAVCASLVIFAIAGGYFFSHRKQQTVERTVVRPQKTIAVLPFVDLGAKGEQEFFAEGISEEILDALKNIRGLGVIGRDSSFAFKKKHADTPEMARKLGAQNLLQGSVRRDANSVAINVQLMNGADGASVWSKTYSAEPDDFTALLPVITRAVADALGFKVDLQPRREIAPSAIITNDLYLQGLLLSRKTNSDDLRTSLDFLRLALAKEQFPRALTISAKDWTRLGESYVRPREAYAEAHKAAREALATNDRDAEAHAYLGEAERVLAWDLKNEESELKRALELDPNCAIAHYFLARLKLFLGDSNSAQQHLDAAKQIDPLSPVIGDLEVYLNVATGRLDQAFAAAQRTMEIDPDYQYFEADLALVYREQGRFAEAIDIYLRLETTRHQPQPGLAITYARSNRPDDARKVLNQLTEFAKTQYFPAEQIAAVFAALGNRDDAFRWLDRAANEHSAGIHQIGCAREFEPLRADPRFAGLLRRIGIDPKNFVRK